MENGNVDEIVGTSIDVSNKKEVIVSSEMNETEKVEVIVGNSSEDKDTKNKTVNGSNNVTNTAETDTSAKETTVKVSSPSSNNVKKERRLSPAREELKRQLLPVGFQQRETKIEINEVEEEDKKKAAIKIQAIQRRNKAKEEVMEIRAKKTAATQKIQNIGRGRAARKRVKKIREEKLEKEAAKEEEERKKLIIEQELQGKAIADKYVDDFEDNNDTFIKNSGISDKNLNDDINTLKEETSLISENTYADDFEESSTDYEGKNIVAEVKTFEELTFSGTGETASESISKTTENDSNYIKKGRKQAKQAAALDMSSYKSPYQINLSKQSRKQARDVKRSSNSININSIGSNNNSSSIVPIGKRAKGSGSYRKIKSREAGNYNRGKTMPISASTSKLDNDSSVDNSINIQSTKSLDGSIPLIAIHSTDVNESRIYKNAQQTHGGHDEAGKVSPLYERIVEMRDSISSIKERFRALKQISELDNEIALEGGWTEKDIKDELVKLKHELARERERLKVTLQNGAHRLGRRSGGLKGSVNSSGSFAPNLSTTSTASSKARERLFSDDVASKLKKLCKNLDKHCRAREREIAAEKRGWVKPLSNKLSPVTRHLKPTFDRNPVAPLFRGSATDPTGGREIGFIHDPRPLGELRARYKLLKDKTSKLSGEKINDDDLQEMWSLEVEIAEAKRVPRYKAQSKSLKRRKQRQYEPVRRRSDR